MLLSLLAAPLLALPATAITTNEGSVCLNSCASWSTTLEHCRNTFSDKDALQKDYFYSNQFLACLCTGQNPNGEYGNSSMSQSASNCESCSTTPALIKKDLSSFINLCAVQAQNGSAANATFFAPVSYKTGDDQAIKDSLEKHSAAPSLAWSGALLTAALGAALSAL